MGIRFRKTKKAGPFRFSLTKKGVGWSIGNKYIGYSHGASGRKSLRASIPGTGISYITPIGGKKRKSTPARKTGKQSATQTEPKENMRYSEMPKIKNTGNKKGILNNKAVATIAAIFIGISALSGGGDDTEPAETARTPETKSYADVQADAAAIISGIADQQSEDLSSKSVGVSVDPEPETVGETIDLLSKVASKETEPETEAPETKKPETQPPETKAPETKAPETKAPVVIVKPETQPPETKAPETKKPETQPPETEPPITITHKDSSLSPELVKALDGVAAFWAPSGSKIHLDPFCSAFKGTVYAGTVADANSVKDGGWCQKCSSGANENTKSNVFATPEVIASCYSLQDYLNKIPATAFD